MRGALIRNGTVVNLISLYRLEDFPGATDCGDLPVAIGDNYDGECFYHDGQQVLTLLEQAEREHLQELADLIEEVCEQDENEINGGD